MTDILCFFWGFKMFWTSFKPYKKYTQPHSTNRWTWLPGIDRRHDGFVFGASGHHVVKSLSKESALSPLIVYIYRNSFSGFLGVPNFRWHTVSIGWLGCPFKRSQRFSSKASLLRAVGEQLVEDQPNPRPWICLVDWFHRFDGQLRRFWRLIMLL